jgi:hypothetical protein
MAAFGLINRVSLQHPDAVVPREVHGGLEQPVLQAQPPIGLVDIAATTDQTLVSSTGFMTGERRSFR